MPSPYAHDAARLKAEIVARAEAGEFLKAICAAPGMPSVLTVRAWSRADALFGEALGQARRRGEWRRLWVVDEAKAAAFLAAARAGQPIRSLLGKPGMPSQTAYRRWKIAQAPFAEAAFALLQRRNANVAAWGRARRREFDAAVADRILVRLNKGPGLKAVLKADPELPSREIVARWRREQPAFDQVVRLFIAARRRAVPPVPAAQVQDIVDHIVEGGAFLSYSRLPGSPAYNTLRHWMRDPGFRDAVAQACEWREHWYEDQIAIAAEQAGPGSARDAQRAIGRLKRQLVRLRHRPHKPLYPPPRRDRPRP